MKDKEAILKFYQENIYGIWRTGEKVSYNIEDIPSGTPLNINIPWVKVPQEYTEQARKVLNINVCHNNKIVSFSITVYLPQNIQTSVPFIVSFHPIEPLALALNKGYAMLVFTDFCLNIASDNNERKGLFYELYPYSKEPQSQTGVLMAWAWAASKVLDALYNGAAKELGLNPDNSIITGVSRWGKAAAVCGAFESRFKMTAPSCSGAGGLALFDYKSEGKTYDFSSKGGDASYTYGKNEPLGALQSKDEQGWFIDKFLEYKAESEIPINQENLINLCADKNRYYFMIASCIGEDWVNGPAMWECIKRAETYYRQKGLSQNLAANIHLQGHAVLQEDMDKLTDYFTLMTQNKELTKELEQLTDFSRKEFQEKNS
ncbi:MAG: hypothetical protein J6X78_08200 [Treponema sp.]|nr:hypothetical protein [Treponema sp.]